MPRSNFCRQPDKERCRRLMDLIVGTGVNRRRYSALAEATGIPAETIRDWDKDPTKMTAKRMFKLLDAVKATDDEIITAIRGGKKK